MEEVGKATILFFDAPRPALISKARAGAGIFLFDFGARPAFI
jgi:hypothetical protein